MTREEKREYLLKKLQKCWKKKDKKILGQEPLFFLGKSEKNFRARPIFFLGQE